mgnify:CR=1 FL=1
MANDANSDIQADELLNTVAKEATKTFSVYDGSDRLITRWEAPSNTVDGKPALKTEYTYIGVTTKLEKSRESIDVWSSAYDI